MKKKGISLISLSIVIAVLFILISTITISVTFSINNAKKMTFAEEIYNIQSLVNEYSGNEQTLLETAETIEISTSDITQFESEDLVDGKILLDVLDLQTLGIDYTSYGNKVIGETNGDKAKDVYAISKATGKVYYVAGVEIGNKKYYTLTDELKKMVEKEQELNISEDTIIFTPNKVGWSNEAITVKVTVPNDYTSPSISINNANIQYSSNIENGITYYNVNTSSVVENYTVTVNYTNGGVVSSAKYTANVDKVAPIISKDTNVANTTGKINGLNAVDSQSGIKYFKYAQNVIPSENVQKYMEVYGKNMISGSINYVVGQTYTLYAEDKAGNYSVVYIDETGNITNN